MASMFRWVVGKVSSTTNSALESVVGGVIRRFLEEPIADDAFNLQLFEDWTMHIRLRRIFLDCHMVNQYVPLVAFKSIYLADFTFDARYNLSSFSVQVTRVLLELSPQAKKEMTEEEPVQEGLTASIQQITESLPVQEEGGWKQWFIAKVKQLQFKLDSATVILSVDGNEPLQVVITKAEYTHDNNIGYGKLQGISIEKGEKKRKKEFFELCEVSVGWKDEALEVIIDKIVVDLSESVIGSLFKAVESVLEASDNGAQAVGSTQTKSEGLKGKFRVVLKHFLLKTSNGLTFDMSDLVLNVVDERVCVELGSFTLSCSDMVVTKFDGRRDGKMKVNVALPTGDVSGLTVFEEPPTGDVFHAMNIVVGLPFLTVNITKHFIDAVFELVQWIPASPVAQPKQVSYEKSSFALTVETPGVLVEVAPVCMMVKNTTMRLWKSETASDSFMHMTCSIGSIHANTSPSFAVIQFIDDSKANLVLNMSVVRKLGRDKRIAVEGHLGPVLVRIPNDFEFVSVLQEMIPVSAPVVETTAVRPELPETHNVATPLDLNLTFTAEYVALDYMTLKMPARLIVAISPVELVCSGRTTPQDLSVRLQTKACAYISNVRLNLPLKAFGLHPFPSAEFGFAHVISIEEMDVGVELRDVKTVVTVNKAKIGAGFCIDSIRVLMAFIMHVQYQLDLPPKEPKQQHPPIEFDHVSHLKQTLTQSLNLAGLEPQKDAPSFTCPVQCIYESIESLVASAAPEIETPIVQEDGDASIVGSDPETVPNIEVHITNAQIDVMFCGGHDLGDIWIMEPLRTTPLVTSEPYVKNDFDIVTSRDDSNAIHIVSSGNASVSLFSDDPSIAVRLKYELGTFVVLDEIHNSASRVILGIAEGGSPLTGTVDVHKANGGGTELSLDISLPELSTFITQEQIKFFMSVGQCYIPVFPSDAIVDEPPRFQLVCIRPAKVHVCAHFRCWLDVHLDDIDIETPECIVFSVVGFDGLIGALAEFYVAEMSKPGVVAVIGGLPVIKNLRRITGAVRDLFTFDVQKYGVSVGLGKSVSALFQIVAMETLNAGANAASIAERFLQVAMRMFGGTKNTEEALESGLATLIIQSQPESLVKRIPTIVLAPGVLTFKKLKDMMKNLRDKVNPDMRKRLQARK